MGPGLFLIAIMGCGDSDSACRTVRTLDEPYRTEAACTAATPAALAGNSDADFPVIVAQCVSASAPARALKGSEVKLPGPGEAQLRASPLSS
jgi:hypothetical protein